jgi:hypothetical protein
MPFAQRKSPLVYVGLETVSACTGGTPTNKNIKTSKHENIREIDFLANMKTLQK